MLRESIPIITFSLTFLLLVNRHVFITLIKSIGASNAAITRRENTELTDYIKTQTGVHIPSFYLIQSDSVFASMTGIPTNPIMTISKGMYDSFSPEELHYIVLHETGHYALWHTVQELLLQCAVIIIAFFVFRSFTHHALIMIAIAAASAMVSGIVMIQITRGWERQADMYALERLHDPRAMITATRKLAAAWGGPADDSLLRVLFYRGVPYSERIRNAESYWQ